MKRFLSITAILAASAAVTLAQPPSVAAKKQAVHVVKTTTTTYDTIALSEPTSIAAAVAYDSALHAKFDKLNQKIEKIEKQQKTTDGRVRTLIEQGSSGRLGSFINSALKNMVPMVPFFAAILIALFWFRYSFKKRVMRQEMIYKYIDRGEQVPEWLTRGEIVCDPTATNESTPFSRKNATLFLVLSIILAAITLIFLIALANAYGWQAITTSLLSSCGFGFATIWCFRQYLKRTE